MDKSFLISLLRHRLTIEAPQRVADGAGGFVETWQAVADVWASIRPRGGGENLAGDRPSGHVTHEIWVRRRDIVTPRVRFRQGTRIFEIRAVLDVDERRRRFRCLCKERDL